MVPGEEGQVGEGIRERRRHRRFRLELSVNVHLGGRPEPVTVEIVDIAARGVRFRSPAGSQAGPPAGSIIGEPRAAVAAPGARAAPEVRLSDEASFGFVSREQHICVAHGRVLRVATAEPIAPGEFVVSVERANAGFHSFLATLAA
jgi:hypothetical protein